MALGKTSPAGRDLESAAAFIEARAEVRYWEDALVNGVEDVEGTLIPLRDGDRRCPIIRLADGRVLIWPQGTKADIHYKICDQGEYWLQNAAGQRVAKWSGHYVPGRFLCHGDKGFGDYIICKVGADGCIEDWQAPEVDPEEWELGDVPASDERPGALYVSHLR